MLNEVRNVFRVASLLEYQRARSIVVEQGFLGSTLQLLVPLSIRLAILFPRVHHVKTQVFLLPKIDQIAHRRTCRKRADLARLTAR